MKTLIGGIDLEHLEVARLYLFGEVKFLDLLMLLMAVDIVTGVSKAIKNQNLWSRKSLFGYARKLLIFGVIIVANVIDQILGLNGAVTYATVLFYMASEGLSIVENMSEMGVLVPPGIADKLHVIKEKQSIGKEVQEEFTINQDKQVKIKVEKDEV
jgi:toxin secretion/phage lysis holin